MGAASDSIYASFEEERSREHPVSLLQKIAHRETVRT